MARGRALTASLFEEVTQRVYDSTTLCKDVVKLCVAFTKPPLELTRPMDLSRFETLRTVLFLGFLFKQPVSIHLKTAKLTPTFRLLLDAHEEAFLNDLCNMVLDNNKAFDRCTKRTVHGTSLCATKGTHATFVDEHNQPVKGTRPCRSCLVRLTGVGFAKGTHEVQPLLELVFLRMNKREKEWRLFY